jgi:hypothetical protein
MMRNFATFIVLLFLAFSCTEEKFGKRSQNINVTGDPIITQSTDACANRTLQKPPVDVLYLVDNSSSIYFLNEAIRDSIGLSLAQLSNDFDYRAMVAPLIPEPGESSLTNFPKFASTPVSSVVIGNVCPAEAIACTNQGSLPPGCTCFQPFQQLVGGAQEHGLKRIADIINANMHSNNTHSFFRRGAYTHVILISNGDDNESVYVNGFLDIAQTNALVNQRINAIKQFTRTYYDQNPNSSLLRSEEFRLFTIVPHSNCATGYINGARYKDASRQIYNYSTGNNVPSESIVDSLNICGANFNSVMSTISQNIKSVTVPHVYNWWPVAPTNNFDTNNIQVQKSTGYVCPRGNTTNGFVFDNVYRTNQETRESPVPPPGTLAEPYTGYLIRLYGQCKVTFPECLKVTVQNPPIYRGYVALTLKPDVSTITVKINGQTINQSTTNGWEYVGNYVGNILITGPDNFTPSPYGQELINAEALKFHGAITPTTFDDISVNYIPDSL